MRTFVPVVTAIALFAASTVASAFISQVTVGKVRGHTLYLFTSTASMNKVSDMVHQYVSVRPHKYPYRVRRLSCTGPGNRWVKIHFAKASPKMMDAGMPYYQRPIVVKHVRQQNTNVVLKPYCP